MNYSGCFSRDKKVCEEKIYEKKRSPEKEIAKAIENDQQENKLLNEVTIGTNLMDSVDFEQPINPLHPLEEIEIDEFKQIYENLRVENFSVFQKVITLNKIFLEKIKNFNIDDPQNEIFYLERIINVLENELKLSIVFLHWALNKSIKHAILETKNVELIHFFLITKKFRLRTSFFSEILCEFIRSFSNIDFLEADEIKVFAWTTMLHMIINYGKADINQQEKTTLCTPLHLSVFFKQYQFIIILLKLDADIEITNKNGFTPLKMAEENINNNYDVAIYEEIRGLLIAFDAKY